jgi:hypothetical protein
MSEEISAQPFKTPGIPVLYQIEKKKAENQKDDGGEEKRTFFFQ